MNALHPFFVALGRMREIPLMNKKSRKDAGVKVYDVDLLEYEISRTLCAQGSLSYVSRQ